MKKYFMFFIQLAMMGVMTSSCSDRRTPVTMNWAVDEEFLDVATELSRGYMENTPHIRITIIPLPPQEWGSEKNASDRFKDIHADILTVTQQELEKLIRTRLISPVNIKNLPSGEKAFFTPALHACRKNDKELYAYPWLINTSVLFYHQKIDGSTVISPPHTWDELDQIVRNIRKDNKRIHGLVLPGKEKNMFARFFIESLWSSGLDIMTEDGEVLLELPQIAIMLKRWKKYLKRQTLSKRSFTYSREKARTDFMNKKSLFYYGLLSEWRHLHTPHESSPDTVRFCLVPATDDYTPSSIMHEQVLVRSADSVHPQEALAFMNFLVSFPSQEVLLMRDFIPALKTVFEKSEAVQYKEGYAEMKDILEHSRVLPYDHAFPRIIAIIDKKIRAVLTGKVSPAEAMNTATNHIRFLPTYASTRKKRQKKTTLKNKPIIPSSLPVGATSYGTDIPRSLTGLIGETTAYAPARTGSPAVKDHVQKSTPTLPTVTFSSPSIKSNYDLKIDTKSINERPLPPASTDQKTIQNPKEKQP